MGGIIAYNDLLQATPTRLLHLKQLFTGLNNHKLIQLKNVLNMCNNRENMKNC